MRMGNLQVDEKAYIAGLLHKMGVSVKDVCKNKLPMRNLMN